MSSLRRKLHWRSFHKDDSRSQTSLHFNDTVPSHSMSEPFLKGLDPETPTKSPPETLNGHAHPIAAHSEDGPPEIGAINGAPSSVDAFANDGSPFRQHVQPIATSSPAQPNGPIPVLHEPAAARSNVQPIRSTTDGRSELTRELSMRDLWGDISSSVAPSSAVPSSSSSIMDSNPDRPRTGQYGYADDSRASSPFSLPPDAHQPTYTRAKLASESPAPETSTAVGPADKSVPRKPVPHAHDGEQPAVAKLKLPVADDNASPTDTRTNSVATVRATHTTSRQRNQDDAEIAADATRRSREPSKNPSEISDYVPDREMKLIAVLIKEATIDSPSFRANMEHSHKQLNGIFSWLSELVDRVQAMSEEMDVLKKLANRIIEHFMPPFVNENIMFPDYMTLAFSRYTEAVRNQWTNVITAVRSHYTRLRTQSQQLKDVHFSKYSGAWDYYIRAQAAYDAAMSAHMAMSKDTEPSELRESAFHLFKLRVAYHHACLELCSKLNALRETLSSTLIYSMCAPFDLGLRHSISPEQLEIAVDMHRLRQAAKAIGQAKLNTSEDVIEVSKESRQSLQTMAPSRQLDSYLAVNANVAATFTPSSSAGDEKFGWVYIRDPSKGSSWVRRWAFVKKDMFGWLSLSPDGTFVQESEKISLRLCSARPARNEDRRFCFAVYAATQAVTIQADSLADLKNWLAVFETGKGPADADDQGLRIRPWLPEFASRTNTRDAAPSQRSLSRRSTTRSFLQSSANPSSLGESLSKETSRSSTTSNSTLDQSLKSSFFKFVRQVEGPVSLTGLSTLGPSSQLSLAPSVLASVPMSTSRTREAIVGSAFFEPSGGVPNAITANYWGSVNWATFQIPTKLHYAPELPRYPEGYPNDLIVQDMDMRALFQEMAEKDDLVVSVMRGFIQIPSKKFYPGRIFITQRNLYCYASMVGLVTLKKISIHHMLNVECRSTLDHDDLQFVFQQASDAPYVSMSLRLYIDSGPLVQRRLQYLLDNEHDNTGVTLDQVLKNLLRINKEYARKVTKQLKLCQAPDMAGADEEGLFGASTTLIDRCLNPSSTQNRRQSSLSAPAHNLNETTDRCVAARTFNTTPRALFYVLFGDRTPVFNGKSPRHAIQSIKTWPWFYKDRRVERRVEIEIRRDLRSSLVFDLDENSKRQIIIQRVDRRDENNLYIVSERRPRLELPRGSQFFLMIHYAISPSPIGGALLEIYASIVWKIEKSGSGVLKKLIYDYAASEASTILTLTAAGVAELDGHNDDSTAARLFGRVRVHINASSGPDDSDQAVIKLPRRVVLMAALRAPFWFLLNTLLALFGKIKEVFHIFASVNRIILLLLGASLLANLFLLSRTTFTFWSAYFHARHADKYVDSVIPVAPRPGSVFRRAIYLADIDDAIRTDGKALGWDRTNVCAGKFMDLAELSLYPAEHPLPRIDPPAQQALEKVQDMRLKAAMERNDLLVRLRMVNDRENEQLRQEYDDWLANEVAMCAKARSLAPLLNETTYQRLREYCAACASAARIL